MSAKYFKNFYAVYYVLLCTNLLHAKVAKRNEVDEVVEDVITYKLADDLLQSIEKKFHVDLERSLDMILTKIHLVLQDGPQKTQDMHQELQASLNDLRAKAPDKIVTCLEQKDHETTALSEKTLHQMVVCGYALIGQDPVVAANKIHSLKNMIREEVQSMNAQKKGIYELLRVCGHEHDSLKKVVKCVISKSPSLKSVMMSVTGKLINGVVELTKILARGAIHEACLIEVLKSAELEAIEILADVRRCVQSENSLQVNSIKSFEKVNKTNLNESKMKKGDNDMRLKVTRGNDVRLNSESNVVFTDIKNDLNSVNFD